MGGIGISMINLVLLFGKKGMPILFRIMTKLIEILVKHIVAIRMTYE